ncbi:MAG: hypothetical protein LAT62_04125 [Natronospirillum sp.]|uniref:glycoside hydrolase family 65 protein n=1 Tax=Natronospirillum sp. TaxID=2812955 RepID=UPI0025DAB509|nr:glycosyl hydrolase family 65 protein [Natronospirillum sp.]MCH8551100.1 hypothetical protein [Natronospirillum sp.]
MQLSNHLQTDTGWEFYERTFDPEQIVTTGSNFMVGNGYMGYRGTFAEWDAEHYVACVVTDTWDTAEPGRLTELCNVPNPLYFQVRVNGETLSAFSGKTLAYERAMDLRCGLFSRRSTWQGRDGGPVTIEEEKFASYDDIHLLVMRYRLTVEEDAEISVLTGIDGRVWSISGEHFRSQEAHTLGDTADLIAMDVRTVEYDTLIRVAEDMTVQGSVPVHTTLRQVERRVLREMTFQLRAGDSLVFEKYASIQHSNGVTDPQAGAVATVERARNTGFDALLAAHRSCWERIWAVSDIQIEGDLESQLLARFNVFHNIIHTPSHARLPVGARGLSCQVYQGAAFWDQETFNLPMYLYTQPELARRILEYRYDTLDGARRKAERLGYQGAYYAWTSGKTGDELFPDFFFTDVLTGRPIRNHFNCWQIHISPDITYALWLYYEATGDWDFIERCGAEMAFEIARFLGSRVHLRVDLDRYELIRLLGPDEYHENVDNNAYTLYLSHFALDKALTLYRQMTERSPQRLTELRAAIDLTDQEVDYWQDILNRLYLPKPDSETLLIEQFDGFFNLEDITPDTLRERLIDPSEYWGWPNGIAVHAQVLKQADLLQLFALVDDFSPEVLRANYGYYEPRTEHGSSLSPSVHALIATKAGLQDEAWRYFKEAATIDLYSRSKKVMSGGSFLGGIHTAACGGIWQVIVRGFSGFEIHDNTLHFQPHLPTPWQRLRFPLTYRDNHLWVTLDDEGLVVEAQERNPGTVNVALDQRTLAVAPGKTVRLATV